MMTSNQHNGNNTSIHWVWGKDVACYC